MHRIQSLPQCSIDTRSRAKIVCYSNLSSSHNDMFNSVDILLFWSIHHYYFSSFLDLEYFLYLTELFSSFFANKTTNIVDAIKLHILNQKFYY